MVKVGSLGHVVASLVVGGAIVQVACTAEPAQDGSNLTEGGSSDPNRAPSNAPRGIQPEGAGPSALPSFKSLRQRCKLVSDRNLDDPTDNETHRRVNLRGTDLGIPIAHDNQLYFFFGDTAGSRGIWPLGPESLPDSVGFASYDAVKSNPDTLCNDLRFLSIATNQGGIERDFAPAAMTPPVGHSINEFIHNPSGPRGGNAFPTLPGDFEVPSGGFSHNGSIYLFYTTVDSPSVVEMKGSYLARWNSPSTDARPNYDILYAVDQRFDGNGPLRGDFINIAPLVVGDFVYLYGTGKYRQSDIHLARKRLDSLGEAGGYERFDATSGTWRPGNDASAKAVARTNGVGELSVRFFPNIRRYVMMDQEVAPNNNRLVARFASAPEGPWSAPVQIASMSDQGFRNEYCCRSESECIGRQMIFCPKAGFYGSYMLPDATENGDGSFTIDFTLSTWNPYNVALMSATFK